MDLPTASRSTAQLSAWRTLRLSNGGLLLQNWMVNQVLGPCLVCTTTSGLPSSDGSWAAASSGDTTMSIWPASRAVVAALGCWMLVIVMPPSRMSSAWKYLAFLVIV